MWNKLVRIIIRNRLINLILIGVITGFMVWKMTEVKMSYQMAQMLPSTDSTLVKYEKFKKQFGQDGSVMFVGIQSPKLFELNTFNSFYDLSRKVKEINGVEEVVSIARLYELHRNDSLKKFDFLPLIKEKPKNQEEMDAIKAKIFEQPFYNGLLFNKDTKANLMMITLDKEILNTKNRVGLIYSIKDTIDNFAAKNDIKVHYSGLPYIRTITTKKIQTELNFFIILSLVIASVILLIFFRSFKAVFFTMLIVGISVVFVLGSIALFGYKITILTGILPPLLIVIVVENSIFLLNKYLNEYKEHGNKAKSLSRMIQRIGNANLLTNMTTAAGFAAFIITGNEILVEFGIIASLNILAAYLLTLFLLPIFFSYLPAPKKKHFKHLNKSKVGAMLEKIVYIVTYKRKWIYAITIVVVAIGLFGVTKLKTTGNIVDDISKKSDLYKDMIFLEQHFKGVMPLEISINTHKKKGILKTSFIKKIDKLQEVLMGYPELSRALSVAEIVKYAKQAFYKGDPKRYEIPNSQEKNFILSYIPKLEEKAGNQNALHSFIDDDLSTTRISVQMANVGTKEIQKIMDDLQPKIDKIFPKDKYDVNVTGTSVVFLKGTNYLVGNLASSLLLALIIISALMAVLFTSARMIFISLMPNLIPQLMTAAMMGYFGISIKPSTILIFSIALGISVDNAIHFLSRYRLYLKQHNWEIKVSVLGSLRETGHSMIYSSVVLFFGFAIFTLSSFGGTEAMGYLISFTLLIALLSNLFVLPSLLLSFDKKVTNKNFSKPLIKPLEIKVEEEEESKVKKEKLA
ncbi:MAG: RND family transporter [Hyphomicrobiales bacterium]